MGGAEPAAELQSVQPPIREQPLTEQNIVGLKYFDELLLPFKRLHDGGRERDQTGNRELHYDQYCLLVLLYLFNPICSSLRAVQQASELKNVQQKLGCARAALRSLVASSAAAVHPAAALRARVAPPASIFDRPRSDPSITPALQTA